MHTVEPSLITHLLFLFRQASQGLSLRPFDFPSLPVCIDLDFEFEEVPLWSVGGGGIFGGPQDGVVAGNNGG